MIRFSTCWWPRIPLMLKLPVKVRRNNKPKSCTLLCCFCPAWTSCLLPRLFLKIWCTYVSVFSSNTLRVRPSLCPCSTCSDSNAKLCDHQHIGCVCYALCLQLASVLVVVFASSAQSTSNEFEEFVLCYAIVDWYPAYLLLSDTTSYWNSYSLLDVTKCQCLIR
jgi:hypothetical protein